MVIPFLPPAVPAPARPVVALLAGLDAHVVCQGEVADIELPSLILPGGRHLPSLVKSSPACYFWTLADGHRLTGVSC
jgi:hypothetical protein